MPFGLGFFATAGGAAPVAVGDYDLLTTTVVGGTAVTTVEFSVSSFSEYKHLQVRIAARSDRATYSQDDLRIFLNSDTTTTNYDRHALEGNGGSVSSSAGTGSDTDTSNIGRLTGSGSQTGAFSVAVIDLLDAYSTTKQKTVRSLYGQESQDAGGFGGKFVGLGSVLWNNTNAITTITFDQRFGSNFVTGSRFSLYGLKG